MRENNAVQGLIGRTEARLRAARAYLTRPRPKSGATSSRGAALTEAHRIALRLAATWTIHQSADVVGTAYHMAGATAVFHANGFERRLRDMHAITQQIQARDAHYEDAGKAILSGNLEAPPTIDEEAGQGKTSGRSQARASRIPRWPRCSLPIQSRYRQNCWHCAG